MAKVTIIPSKINPITLTPVGQVAKRKVAAYARVSTDSDEQYTSYDAQVTYYTNFIKGKPNWEFVKVYADEGISGTSTKRRDEFKEMIESALNGKIDLIITKSISRFARNTLDTISITRQLKAKGIEVYFEKENLWSLDDKTEFLLTIMASIAQEESRSISQNITIGKRWGMKEGKVSFAYKNFLGYKKVDGKIVVDEAQAETVRLIYMMFLKEGKTCTGIAEFLKSKGIPTPSGKSCNWTKNTVYSILTNEKYKGDALLQKKYTADYLEHRVVPNNGELPQYYVENNHPAIIEREVWEMVQTEMMRRSMLGAAYSGNSIFASKLICGDCGKPYGKKKWHSTSKYAREIYRCNAKYNKGQTQCQTPNLTEEDIKTRFIKAYNLVMCDKKQVIEDTLAVIELLADTTDLDAEIANLQTKIERISSDVSLMVRENARTQQDQIKFAARYEELTKEYETQKAALEKAVKEKAYKTGKATKMRAYLEAMKQADDFLEEWSDEVWILMVETATVNRDKTITFRFTGGKEITL
jgi:resolvase domain protein|nr:MAG TPA: integrase [Caudoviricetes sp.]